MSLYHVQTAYVRENMAHYSLDWPQQPNPFKHYLHRQTLPLPNPRPPKASFFDLALGWPPRPLETGRPFDAADLAAVCLMTAGITARGSVGLRAAASAGALYPGELYASVCQVSGIDDGLYHFSPEKPGLHHLRQDCLARAMARSLGSRPAALTFIISAMFWRSVWKYRTRAYRYCLLDSGHMLANLELALCSCGLGFHSVFDFSDSPLGVMMGLATDEEVPLLAVSAGGAPPEPGPGQAPLPPFDLQHRQLSRKMARDAMALEAHEAGNLESPAPAGTWQTADPPPGASPLPAPDPPRGEEAPGLLEVIRTRRSRRNFLPAGLDGARISTLLATSLAAPSPLGATLFLAPGPKVRGGVYHYHAREHALEQVSASSEARGKLAKACLGQLWVGQAAMSLLLWADLESLQETHGPRGYRHAMLSAGRAGQRLYLAATALGLGCCGVGAFYDDEVAALAQLPQGALPLYLLSVGPVKGFPA